MLLPEHVTIVERWFDDLFVSGDLDAVDDLVARDFVAHGQDGMDDAYGRETSEMSDLQVVMQLGAFPVPEEQ